MPEEHFYASLYYHNHTYPISNLRTYPSVTVYQWMTTVKTEEANRYCRGKTVRLMCILTSADLARIYKEFTDKLTTDCITPPCTCTATG